MLEPLHDKNYPTNFPLNACIPGERNGETPKGDHKQANMCKLKTVNGNVAQGYAVQRLVLLKTPHEIYLGASPFSLHCDSYALSSGPG